VALVAPLLLHQLPDLRGNYHLTLNGWLQHVIIRDRSTPHGTFFINVSFEVLDFSNSQKYSVEESFIKFMNRP
jgi:hypothetical protein